ncbi:MAG: hypothetical protein IJY61_05930 [Candidatus Gastranaerophilales bacterium]|nr:hypothetical protein [Candidatus Gastranaerophilales bacterium]
MKNKQVILVAIFVFLCMVTISYALTCGIYTILDYKKLKDIEKAEQIKKEQIKIAERRAEEERYVRIPFKEPSALSYKSKEEIYKIRENAVQNSIFKNPNYHPSNAVFGQIESGKPWNSMRQCRYDATGVSDIKGPSEEGRYINNPELLVSFEYAYYGYSCEERKTYELRYSRPESITYDKKKNEIEVVFGGFPYCTHQNAYYGFKGLNARDLGYKYIYVDKEKSTFDLDFVEEFNVSNSVVELQDFIHVGGSCGHKEGCNNASPNQPPLNFYYPCTDGNGKLIPNKTISVKLWKNRPNSPQDEPDITEKIVIKKVWVNRG